MTEIIAPSDRRTRPDEMPGLPERVVIRGPEHESDVQVECMAIGDTAGRAEDLAIVIGDEQVCQNLAWVRKNLAEGKTAADLVAMAAEDWGAGAAFRYLVVVDDRPAGYYAVTVHPEVLGDDNTVIRPAEIETTSGLMEAYRGKGIGKAVSIGVMPFVPNTLGILVAVTYKPDQEVHNPATYGHMDSLGRLGIKYAEEASERPGLRRFVADLTPLLGRSSE